MSHDPNAGPAAPGRYDVTSSPAGIPRHYCRSALLGRWGSHGVDDQPDKATDNANRREDLQGSEQHKRVCLVGWSEGYTGVGKDADGEHDHAHGDENQWRGALRPHARKSYGLTRRAIAADLRSRIALVLHLHERNRVATGVVAPPSDVASWTSGSELCADHHAPERT